MMRRTGVCALLVLLLTIGACGDDDSVDTDTPEQAYRTFFTTLAAGDTEGALEALAPEGALGNTFTSGAYRMLANEFANSLEHHGDIDEILIDREEVAADDEVLIEGRIRFSDGTEMARNIRFVREGERWVGHI
jgi:hypothetical protein